MLNQRQTEIILEIYENSKEFFTAAYFAQKKNVSLRTIQNDMSNIRSELANTGCARIRAKKSRGSYLEILDYDIFSNWINDVYMQYNFGPLNYPLNRINKIIFILLGRFRDTSLLELSEMLYISPSTLNNDLRNVQDSIEKFRLSLHRNMNKISIVGTEIDKRRCLAENNLYLAHVQPQKNKDSYIDMQRISYIKNILLDSFIENQYYISDIDFNNAILMLNIMLHRAQKKFFIHDDELDISDNITDELAMSQKIFKKLKLRFLCNIPEAEIQYFALYLKGQEICKDNAIISKEMDSFIARAFIKIKKMYGIDFSNNVNLRIAMSLHCIPLVIRLKYNMQIQGSELNNIKQSFPLGYEVASYFAFLLQEKYGKRIVGDEIALIAAHFYSSLLELRQKTQKTRVLIISSLKMSMTMLLRSMLMKWFSKEIVELEFMQTAAVTEDVLDRYDVYLTTEKNVFYTKGIAMYINLFPTENDHKNIKILLDGFANIDDVVQIFTKKLFFSMKHCSKAEILREMTKKAEKEYNLTNLYEAVLKREKIGSTFFSKGIAIPHPIQALSSDTFISTCIMQEPISWDEEKNSVQLIMLVHIGKNNPQSFQLWDYLSNILEEKLWVTKIVKEPTWENFICNIRCLLNGKFVSEE